MSVKTLTELVNSKKKLPTEAESFWKLIKIEDSKESSKLGSELEGGLHKATEDIIGAFVVTDVEE